MQIADTNIHENMMSCDENGWMILASSVQGNGHKSMDNMPCQDSCGYESLGMGWGIAVVSDGAGSAVKSDLGSEITVARCLENCKTMISEKGWMQNNTLPTQEEWENESQTLLRRIHEELRVFAYTHQISLKDLSATLIMVIHTPQGLLVAHVGDGRAGYRDKDGNWKELIVPHKGEEANQTIFMTSALWDMPDLMFSGVKVPEARVIKDMVSAFTLMSDGCESTAWLCNIIDEQTGKFIDPNKPYPRFFEPLLEYMDELHETNEDHQVRKSKWYHFISQGNRKFMTEPDDKTILLAKKV